MKDTSDQTLKEYCIDTMSDHLKQTLRKRLNMTSDELALQGSQERYGNLFVKSFNSGAVVCFICMLN